MSKRRSRMSTTAAVLAMSAAAAASLSACEAPQATTASVACSGKIVAGGADIQNVINASPEGATICISAGTYRLSTPLVPKAGQKLWGQSGTVLSGARVLKGFTASNGAWVVPGQLPAAWNAGGVCEDNVTNPCQRAEQVFRNGKPLARVMSRAALTRGTFFPDYAANKIYVADDPTGATMEVSRTAFGIKSSAPDVTVKNLTVEKFATPAQRGALYVGGDRWTVTGNTVRYNHAIGVYLDQADNSRITANTVVNNGQLGIGQYKSTDVTTTNNEIAYNNNDGFWIADWESGGFKVTYSLRAVVSNNKVHDNAGVGIWADISNRNTTFSGNTISRNGADGVRFEISYGGSITGNTVVGNGFGLKRNADYSLYAVAGINVNTSSDVTVANNTVTDNANGIGLQMRNRGTGLYGAYELRNAWVHDNVVTMRKGTLWGQGSSGLVQNVGNTGYFTSKSNRFTNNTYYLDSLSSRRFAWSNTYSTSTGWRGAQQDTTGKFLLATTS